MQEPELLASPVGKEPQVLIGMSYALARWQRQHLRCPMLALNSLCCVIRGWPNHHLGAF